MILIYVCDMMSPKKEACVMHNYFDFIGRNIQQAQSDAGMTQEQLARELDISTSDQPSGDRQDYGQCSQADGDCPGAWCICR